MIEQKKVPMSLLTTHGFAIHDRTEFSKKANLLRDIAKNVSMHGIVDGEDSSGHYIVRPLTTDKIMVRSVHIVDALLSVCQDRKWMLEKGSIEEMYEGEPQRTGFR